MQPLPTKASTTCLWQVRAAGSHVNGLYASGGGDIPESGLEALEAAFKKSDWSVETQCISRKTLKKFGMFTFSVTTQSSFVGRPLGLKI